MVKNNITVVGTAVAVALAGSSLFAGTAHATSRHQTTTTPQAVACKTSDIQINSRNGDLSQVTIALKSSSIQKGVTTCDVSLNSYSAEGPTWPTSGVQALISHDTVTLTKANPSATLHVQTASCYGQNDLYLGTKRFDGVDSPLPKYPHSPVPTDLITAWNGGKACAVATPPAVTHNDICGTDQDTYTIPAKDGVEYRINGHAVNAGTYNGTGSVTITAVAKAGYVLSGTASWTLTFTNDACPTPDVNIVDTQCSDNGVVVTLTNSGNADGTATVNGQTITVAASKTTTVTIPFDAHKTASVKVEINGKVVSEKTVTCGTHAPTTPTTPSTPQILDAATATTPAVLPAALPSTGANSNRIVLIATTFAVLTYGLAYVIRDRFAAIRNK